MPHRKTILIVDDNVVNIKMLENMLYKDYNVLIAYNGLEAWNLLREKRQQISCVLLDLVMPIMDGYTLLKKLKQDDILQFIPVIVVTGENADGTELATLSGGAMDFLQKGAPPAIIKQRIINVIDRVETEKLLNVAEYDQLTKLYSKTFFDYLVRKYLQEHPQQQFDLFVTDIGEFSLINNAFGEKNANLLLQHLATLLEHIPGVLLAGRLEKDNMVVLVEHQEQYPMQELQHINKELNSTELEMQVYVNFGIYPQCDPREQVADMCNKALYAIGLVPDRQLQLVSVYDQRAAQRFEWEMAMTASVERGLQESQFVSYFQPKYELATGKLVGAEALVRWYHPNKGFIPPDQFVPVFERNGYVGRLDRYMRERVGAMAAQLHKMGQEVAISVNISQVELYNPHLVEEFVKLVEKYEVPPSAIHVEVTETSLAERTAEVIKVLRHFKDEGFVIELDDFGTGYSSLYLLNLMLFSVIKIDKSLVDSGTSQEMGGKVLDAILTLAQNMEITTVAEGVEDERQQQLLIAKGCNIGQGFLYSKPLPADEFLKFVQAHNTSK